ncbi:hypothetical protein MRB53_039600 [Persea americana]|nr:hypothetical protein MRB53_039600 [Persea americana]
MKLDMFIRCPPSVPRTEDSVYSLRTAIVRRTCAECFFAVAMRFRHQLSNRLLLFDHMVSPVNSNNRSRTPARAFDAALAHSWHSGRAQARRTVSAPVVQVEPTIPQVTPRFDAANPDTWATTARMMRFPSPFSDDHFGNRDAARRDQREEVRSPQSLQEWVTYLRSSTLSAREQSAILRDIVTALDETRSSSMTRRRVGTAMGQNRVISDISHLRNMILNDTHRARSSYQPTHLNASSRVGTHHRRTSIASVASYKSTATLPEYSADAVAGHWSLPEYRTSFESVEV